MPPPPKGRDSPTSSIYLMFFFLIQILLFLLESISLYPTQIVEFLSYPRMPPLSSPCTSHPFFFSPAFLSTNPKGGRGRPFWGPADPPFLQVAAPLHLATSQALPFLSFCRLCKAYTRTIAFPSLKGFLWRNTRFFCNIFFSEMGKIGVCRSERRKPGKFSFQAD